MASDSNIRPVFVKAISRDGRERRIATPATLQKQLLDVNHIHDSKTVPAVVRYYPTFFFELVTEEREKRTWALSNMG